MRGPDVISTSPVGNKEGNWRFAWFANGVKQAWYGAVLGVATAVSTPEPVQADTWVWVWVTYTIPFWNSAKRNNSDWRNRTFIEAHVGRRGWNGGYVWAWVNVRTIEDILGGGWIQNIDSRWRLSVWRAFWNLYDSWNPYATTSIWVNSPFLVWDPQIDFWLWAWVVARPLTRIPETMLPEPELPVVPEPEPELPVVPEPTPIPTPQEECEASGWFWTWNWCT